MSFDIYNEIFRQNYGVSLEDINIYNAKKIKYNIKKLRNSYRADNPKTDYFNQEIRKAYMVAYYPNYTKPSYELMEKYIGKEIEDKLNKNLKAVFFSAGPGAEAFGVSKYLSDIGYKKKLNITLADYEEEWNEQRVITSNLIKVLNNIKINGLEHIGGCDLTLNCKKDCMNWMLCEKKIYNADIFFMQNCLNHIGTYDNFYKNLLAKIQFIKKGALFIIIDLNYDVSKGIIKKLSIEKNIQVIHSNIDGIPVNSTISGDIYVNNKIDEKIFDGTGLIRKRNTSYYYIIIKR